MSKKRSSDSDRRLRSGILAEKGEHLAREHVERRRKRSAQAAEKEKARGIKPEKARALENAPSIDKRTRLRANERRIRTEIHERPPPLEEDFNATTDVEQMPIRAKKRKATSPKLSSPLDLLSIELDVFFREVLAAMRCMCVGERVALGSALGMLVGVFFPWVSTSHQANQLGFFSGGIFHAGIALVALRLVFQRHRVLLKKKRGARRELEEKRIALWLVLLGVLSTLMGAALLFSWGASKSVWFHVDFHAALYWSLAAGTGVSYGGFACFRRFK